MAIGRDHRAFSREGGRRPMTTCLSGRRPTSSARTSTRVKRPEETSSALRRQAILRLLDLVMRGAELPSPGKSGIILPPLSKTVLGSQLGCLPAQAGAVLDGLMKDGLLAREGMRLRIPDLHALRKAGS